MKRIQKPRRTGSHLLIGDLMHEDSDLWNFYKKT